MDASSRVLVLSLGGMLGVNARYWLSLAIDRWLGTRFPWATLAINVSGAFLVGLLATLMIRLAPHHPLRLLCLVGFLGGYTTFSTFALESYRLAESGHAGRSSSYVIASIAAGLVAVAAGIGLGRAIGGPVITTPPAVQADE